MAIKVNNTVVIDSSRNVSNVVDMTGHYKSYIPKPATATDNIGFENSIQTCVLAADTTFTESGTGVTSATPTCTLLLDTSSSSYTPTFSSNINWENNTEPTWSTYRKWQITFHEIIDSPLQIHAAAVGFDAQASQPTESVSLSGTTSSPETHFDTPGASSYTGGWVFKADGNIYQYLSPNNGAGASGESLHSSTQWNNITPSQTYYIRVTNFSGDNLDTGLSASLNTWIALNATRRFYWRDTRNPQSYADTDGTCKVEISSSSSGSPILATGYYGARWSGFA